MGTAVTVRSTPVRVTVGGDEMPLLHPASVMASSSVKPMYPRPGAFMARERISGEFPDAGIRPLFAGSAIAKCRAEPWSALGRARHRR
jgi:hypothetical protein